MDDAREGTVAFDPAFLEEGRGETGQMTDGGRAKFLSRVSNVDAPNMRKCARVADAAR
jgi:hypothetical protein